MWMIFFSRATGGPRLQNLVLSSSLPPSLPPPSPSVIRFQRPSFRHFPADLGDSKIIRKLSLRATRQIRRFPAKYAMFPPKRSFPAKSTFSGRFVWFKDQKEALIKGNPPKPPFSRQNDIFPPSQKSLIARLRTESLFCLVEITYWPNRRTIGLKLHAWFSIAGAHIKLFFHPETTHLPNFVILSQFAKGLMHSVKIPSN